MAVELDAVGVSRSIIIGAGNRPCAAGDAQAPRGQLRLARPIPIVQFLQLDTVPLQEDVRYPKR